MHKRPVPSASVPSASAVASASAPSASAVASASAPSASAVASVVVSVVASIVAVAVAAVAIFAAALSAAPFCTKASAADGNAADAEGEKTEVFVSVTDAVVAHTAMDNPVKYTLIPEEAGKSAEVKISYRLIKSLSDEGKEVSVPKDIGKYLVCIKVSFSDPRYFCAGKYLVYEIAEKQGEPLPEEEAKKSVPTLFRASVENKRAVYSVSYEAPKYSFNVASVKPRLMYSHIYANGSTGEYTCELPREPGDYAASCFVLDTEVGRGRLTVNKLALKIEMEDKKSCVYDPGGIGLPRARAVISQDSSIDPDDIEFEYKAYIYENETAGKSVPLPLRDCGRYLVSASPADTAHFAFSLARCELVVEKATPVISASGVTPGEGSLPIAVCVEDLLPKPLVFSVSPAFADWSVSYSRLEDGVPAGTLFAPPVFAGDYLAVVVVKGSECVVSATKVFGIRIEKPEIAVRDPADAVLKVLCIVVASAALLLGGVQILAAKRRKAAHGESAHIGGSGSGGSGSGGAHIGGSGSGGAGSGGSGSGGAHIGGSGSGGAGGEETNGEGEGGK